MLLIEIQYYIDICACIIIYYMIIKSVDVNIKV